MKEMNPYSFFGIKKERAEQLQKDIAHAMVDNENMLGVAEKLDLAHGGELCYKAYLFGVAIAHNQQVEKEKRLKSFMGL